MIAMVQERTGATVPARGAMYKSVVQSMLLYGSKIWVVTWEMIKVLTSFNHRLEQQTMGMTEKLWQAESGSTHW